MAIGGAVAGAAIAGALVGEGTGEGGGLVGGRAVGDGAIVGAGGGVSVGALATNLQASPARKRAAKSVFLTTGQIEFGIISLIIANSTQPRK
ncbi:MAG: hypothetical protein Fur0044_16770 [Anaerolineae bacterium]